MAECYPREAGAPPVEKVPFSRLYFSNSCILTGPSGSSKRGSLTVRSAGLAVGTQRFGDASHTIPYWLLPSWPKCGQSCEEKITVAMPCGWLWPEGHAGFTDLAYGWTLPSGDQITKGLRTLSSLREESGARGQGSPDFSFTW